MSQNPYQSPQSSGEPPRAVGVLSGSREDLRSVAQFQGIKVGLMGANLSDI